MKVIKFLVFTFPVWLLWSFVSSLHNISSLHLERGMALWVCSLTCYLSF